MLQPFKNGLALSPRGIAGTPDGLYLGKGLALHLEIDAGVAIGGIGARMP